MTLLITLVALNLLVNLACGIVICTKFYFDTGEYKEDETDYHMISDRGAKK